MLLHIHLDTYIYTLINTSYPQYRNIKLPHAIAEFYSTARAPIILPLRLADAQRGELQRDF